MAGGPLWWPIPWVTCMLLACGESAFNPATSDLTGRWHLVDHTDPLGADPTFNPCDGRLTLTITADSFSLGNQRATVASTDSTGIRHCSSEFGSGDGPYLQRTDLYVVRTGSAISINLNTGWQVWVGRVESENVMAGRVDSTYEGRAGPWRATR